MKLKPSFDKTKIKQFFILHGEKLALVVFSGVFVAMCYSAYQTRGYDKTPNDLKSRTEATRSMVVDHPFDPAKENITLPKPPYVEQAKGAMQPVNPAPFLLATLWNIPLYENRVRRDEPKYLPARDLQLASGFGAVRLKKGGYTGKRWVVVTALAPFADQLAAYTEKFNNALTKDAGLDTPRYARFEVERAEVNSTNPDKATLKWQPVDVKAALIDDSKTLAAERVQVIDKKFGDPMITRPLPPLLGKQPDESMAHPPEVPFVLQTAEKDEKKAEKPPEVEDDPFNPRNDAAGFRPVVINAPGAGPAAVAEVAPVRLFRFFDYNVESSHSYIYRVKLIVSNPNKGVVTRHLKDPKLADGDTRDCPWSEPSPVAVIPHDYRMLAGDVKAPVGAKEAQAKILVVKWEAPKGVEVAHEFGAVRNQELVRGTLLDFADADASIPYPDKPESMSGKVSFVTSTLLIDMTGGELIQLNNTGGNSNARIRSPSEMVFMGPTGEVFTRSAVTDFPEYTARKPAGSAKQKGEMPADEPASGDKPPPGKTIFNLGN
jgi:hypothetical protein